MVVMTNLEKEEFKKVCEEEWIENIPEENIEELLKIQKDWELHSKVESKESMLDRMEKIIFDEK